MSNGSQPFVSIVTPVYNGEKYLSECIESVLEQTYTNWEYIMLDNCSDDNSLAIAKQYAAQDERIKVIANDEFLKQIPNWNESMRTISSTSKYCKVVHADDCLLPECLEKMVAKAEEYPSAGIVSSYRFLGTKICGLHGEGLPYTTTFLKGKEAGKMVMEDRNYLFGSPTTVLYRSDLVRSKDPFYDPSVIHADADTCFELLQDSDFAFVHQPLSFSRMHKETATTFCDFYNTYILHDLYAIQTFGDYFLTPGEQTKLIERIKKDEHHWLARALFRGRDKNVLLYHKEELQKMNLRINWLVIFKFWLLELAKIKPAMNWVRDRFSNLTVSKNGNETVDQIIQKKREETALQKG